MPSWEYSGEIYIALSRSTSTWDVVAHFRTLLPLCVCCMPLRQVLSNFLTFVEEEEDVESVQLIVVRRGALETIVAAIKTFMVDSTIVQAGMDALCNVLADPYAVEEVAENDEMIELVIHIIQSNDWDEQVHSPLECVVTPVLPPIVPLTRLCCGLFLPIFRLVSAVH
jgi:hypothetical protein